MRTPEILELEGAMKRAVLWAMICCVVLLGCESPQPPGLGGGGGASSYSARSMAAQSARTRKNGAVLLAILVVPFVLTIRAVARRPTGRRTLLPLSLWLGLLGVLSGGALSHKGGDSGAGVFVAFGVVTLIIAGILLTALVLWAWPRTRPVASSSPQLFGFFLGGIVIGVILGILR